MAVYQNKNKNIKTAGVSLQGFIQGLGTYKEAGVKILAKYGINDPKQDEWYPLSDYLKAFEELEKTLGKAALFSVGEKIPENAVLPPEIDSVEKALAGINIAYHMNHSLDGKKMMFDPATGKFESGIGTYTYKQLGEGEAEIIADNPYPTSFDEGLIFAMAQCFNTASIVSLVEERSSRSKGGDVDVYLIQWF